MSDPMRITLDPIVMGDTVYKLYNPDAEHELTEICSESSHLNYKKLSPRTA